MKTLRMENVKIPEFFKEMMKEVEAGFLIFLREAEKERHFDDLAAANSLKFFTMGYLVAKSESLEDFGELINFLKVYLAEEEYLVAKSESPEDEIMGRKEYFRIKEYLRTIRSCKKSLVHLQLEPDLLEKQKEITKLLGNLKAQEDCLANILKRKVKLSKSE